MFKKEVFPFVKATVDSERINLRRQPPRRFTSGVAVMAVPPETDTPRHPPLGRVNLRSAIEQKSGTANVDHDSLASNPDTPLENALFPLAGFSWLGLMLGRLVASRCNGRKSASVRHAAG